MTPQTTPFHLDRYRWKNRLLLVFAPASSSEDYQRQKTLLADCSQALKARDLLIVEVFVTDTSTLDGQPLSAEDAARLGVRFAVAPKEFAVLLIGKDGTVKRRDRQPIQPSDLFSTIDAMPLRQHELAAER
ncbi:DUF4174 domain-containing protein [Almyronema epifaneia]|uniref:DUF4174 domain-containing protein n=1 Tax=Almyronema epifaneia S1 TaxID=2991925 RepID=A0ABW6IKY4_9CYAN